MVLLYFWEDKLQREETRKTNREGGEGDWAPAITTDITTSVPSAPASPTPPNVPRASQNSAYIWEPRH